MRISILESYLKKTPSGTEFSAQVRTVFEEATRERLARYGEFTQTLGLEVFLAVFTREFNY